MREWARFLDQPMCATSHVLKVADVDLKVSIYRYHDMPSTTCCFYRSFHLYNRSYQLAVL